MTWNACELTRLLPEDRVTLFIASDEEGAHWVLGASVVAVDLLECTGHPWCDYLDGDPPSLVVDFDNFAAGLQEDDDLVVLTVWMPSSTGHSERLRLLPDPPQEED